MNTLEHTRLMLSAAQEGMLAWVSDVFQRANITDYVVLDDFPERDDAPWLVARAYQVVPWPKVVETTSAVPLASPGGGTDESAQSVPDLWRQLGRAFGAAVDQLFPRPEGGSRTRVVATTALTDLPPALRAWYQSQPADAPEQWVVSEGRCRLPTLMWRPPLVVRVTALLMAGGRRKPGDAFAPGVAVLGAISVALNQHRTMRLRVAPIPSPEPLWSLIAALAEGVGGELAEDLTALAGRLTVPADYPVSLSPNTGPSGDDAYELMRALGRPLLPALHLAMHLPLGAGVELSPGTSPSFSTRGKDPSRGGR